MAQMDWSKLLSAGRLQHPTAHQHPHRPAYEVDADRITFSAPFRRLANKTQVHPLYDHDHLHHRLIHSLETASVGRSLGIEIGAWLEEQAAIEPGTRYTIAGMVQAACLAHDIGNPPFGHSGEDTIGEWFAERFDDPSDLFAALPVQHRHEFIKFEGNAQGFRILTRLEMYRHQGGMRLTHGVLGAFTKYPVAAHVQKDLKGQVAYSGLKKPGLFASEAALFDEVAEATGLIRETSDFGPWHRRHPLVYLVEAADDICYQILDLEDAFTAGDLSFDTVCQALAPLAKSSRDAQSTEAEHITHLRAQAIGNGIRNAVAAFQKNYASIMDGTFSRSLIEASDVAGEFDKITYIANTRIFTARRKTELELMGRNVIRKILSGVVPVFEDLHTQDWDLAKLSDHHEKLARALELDLRDIRSPSDALHALCDYVSGMTDRYAVKIADLLP